MRGVAVPFILTLALGGCAAPGVRSRTQRDAELAAYTRQLAGITEEQAGKSAARNALSFHATDTTSDGRFATIRGTIANSSDEEVKGVRYVVRLLNFDGDFPRELESFQRELTLKVPPNGRRALHIEVESMYLGVTGGVRWAVNVRPVKFGNLEVEPPSGWKQ